MYSHKISSTLLLLLRNKFVNLPDHISTSSLDMYHVAVYLGKRQIDLNGFNIITIADRANEIIRRQELAEERKARLAELGSVTKKKKGKKGKKKGVGKKKGETTVKKKSICWNCDFGSKLLVLSHRQLTVSFYYAKQWFICLSWNLYYFLSTIDLCLLFWINYFGKSVYLRTLQFIIMWPCNIYLHIWRYMKPWDNTYIHVHSYVCITTCIRVDIKLCSALLIQSRQWVVIMMQLNICIS